MRPCSMAKILLIVVWMSVAHLAQAQEMRNIPRFTVALIVNDVEKDFKHHHDSPNIRNEYVDDMRGQRVPGTKRAIPCT